MPATRYEALEAPDDKATEESSSSARLTPDSDFEDEDQYTLGQLENEGGYELRELRRESDAGAGAEEEEDDDEAPLAGGRRKRRRSSVQSFELYTPDEERRVRWKLDTRLVLFVALLYMMVSYLHPGLRSIRS